MSQVRRMLKVETPEMRHEDGSYYFVHGYSGWGNPYGSHLSPNQISDKLTEKAGPGELVDDGTRLWWDTSSQPAAGDAHG